MKIEINQETFDAIIKELGICIPNVNKTLSDLRLDGNCQYCKRGEICGIIANDTGIEL